VPVKKRAPGLQIGAPNIFFGCARLPKGHQMPIKERATAVRTIHVPQTTVFPLTMATGYVQPGQVWQAIAQVGGKVVALHPRLKQGALINADEILVKLDPSDYELAIAYAETEIESVNVQLAQVDVHEGNDKASLAIERQALKIARDELQRKQKLLDFGSLSPSDVEKEQRNVLVQQQRVQALLNSINLYPVDRRRLRTDLAKLETQVAIAKLNLERTTIRMPFNGRIASVNIEYQQFVGQGRVMVVADSIDTAEILVQMPMPRLANLVQSDVVVNAENADYAEIGKLIGLSASVQLQQNNDLIVWDAKVVRVGHELDPRTRTVDIIIEVDKPYGRIQPGKRPPLVKGLFVDVKLSGRPQMESVVIPLSALQDRQVYVVNAENRLQRRNVIPGIRGSDYVIVKEGLRPDERIVISDLVPAIDGMLLTPVDDEQALTQLLSSVGGGFDK
jgi:multidrug efflux system membrane fusion protein